MQLEDFTVGWICALEFEFTAARATLDEEYTGLDEQDVQDHNIYRFGRIGKHEIVIACLPAGKVGAFSAATVAKDMLRSFPSLRFGLMVGIGEGLPSKGVDIRLGDVVVSHPTSNDGGVIQYDLSKLLPGGMFARRGVLNKPPLVLLSGVEALRSDNAIHGSKLPAILERMADRVPRQRKNFKKPHLAVDIPFEAECEHPGEDICDQCCNRLEESRDIRIDDVTGRSDNSPHIHYGVIASDSSIIPSKQAREKLQKTAPIICFEMEAAGLMDSFPCLVIRGIYDYADALKRDYWEKYAAATAAAYARELLQIIPAGKVQQMATAQTVVNTTVAIGPSFHYHDSRNSDDGHDSGARRDVLGWLPVANSSAQQADNQEQRQPGTGQWLLDSPEYRAWVSRQGSSLFCPGRPGAGKTMMASAVIQHLRATFQGSNKTGIFHFYCSYNRHGEQTLEFFLASMVKQLSEDMDMLPESLNVLQERHAKRRSKPSVPEYLEVLKDIMTNLSTTFIVVDAVDEWASDKKSLDRVLDILFKLQSSCGAHLFVTSRFTQDITQRFKGVPSVEIRAPLEDIHRYLQGHLTHLASCVQANKTLQKETYEAIAEASDGMFILAKLHLDSLRDIFQPTKIKAALAALKARKFKEKSEALRWAYRQAVERIEAQSAGHVHFAKQILSWMTCAKRPLTVTELRHALAVDEDSSFDEEDLVDVKDILSVCANLLVVDEQTQVIRFIHQTAHDFFTNIRQMWLPEAYTFVTSSCIAYLSNNAFEAGITQSDEAFKKRLQSYPLLDFASNYWGTYVNEGDFDQLHIGVLDLLSKPGTVATCFEVIMNTKFSHREYNERSLQHPTAAHLAAYFNLKDFVHRSRERSSGGLIEAGDDEPRKPLAWIEGRGQPLGVKLLAGRRESDADSETSRTYIKKEPL